MWKNMCGLICLAIISGCNRGGGQATGMACQSTADCQAGMVCVSTSGSASICVANCTVSANLCSASETCTGVGTLAIDVCEPKSSSQDSGMSPSVETQPKVPCKVDSECADLVSEAICAQFKGERDCTLSCSKESDCPILSVGGITFDFFTCAKDEGNPSRKACLPDLKCVSNPSQCISGLPGFPDVESTQL